MMKVATIVSVLFAVSQIGVAENSGVFSPEEETCITQLNLNKDEIETVLNDAAIYLPENNENFNKFLNCYWTVKKYQSENGEINYDILAQQIKDFPKDKFGGHHGDGSLGLQIATDALNGCKDIPKGNSQGQTIAKVQNCLARLIREYVKKNN